MFPIIAVVSRLHFDSVKVQREADRAMERKLKRFGAFVRRSAQQSMRTKKAGVYSPPGSPPYSHSGKFKKGILFAYDRQTKSVVVGPTLFERTAAFRIPGLHEFGGKDRRGFFAARPVMAPAFMKELSNFKQNFGG